MLNNSSAFAAHGDAQGAHPANGDARGGKLVSKQTFIVASLYGDLKTRTDSSSVSDTVHSQLQTARRRSSYRVEHWHFVVVTRALDGTRNWFTVKRTETRARCVRVCRVWNLDRELSQSIGTCFTMPSKDGNLLRVLRFPRIVLAKREMSCDSSL